MSPASSSERLVRAAPPPGAANGHRAGTASGPNLPTRNHPRGYITLAVALILTCGALGFWFYTQAGSKVAAVVAVRDIPVGQTISRADLSTVDVAGGVIAVAGSHLQSLVGQVAVVEIQPNTLVQRSMVAAAAPLSPAEAIVGTALSAGQIPSAGLRPGDQVQVIGLAQKGVTSGAASASTVLAESVPVYDVRANPSAPGGLLVSLLVPRTAALPIATASNAGLIALVRVGG